jgi:hypothetical protein
MLTLRTVILIAERKNRSEMQNFGFEFWIGLQEFEPKCPLVSEELDSIIMETYWAIKFCNPGC